jgi:hypothetical protein
LARVHSLVLLSVTLAACTPSAPEVHVLQRPLWGADTAIYLTAPRQKAEIARALQAAGFTLVEQPTSSAYLLRVNLGNTQGSEPCGTLHNVRYELRDAGRTLVVAEAKGWTGTCQPNVFDDVSRELRKRMIEVAQGGTDG